MVKLMRMKSEIEEEKLGRKYREGERSNSLKAEVRSRLEQSSLGTFLVLPVYPPNPSSLRTNTCISFHFTFCLSQVPPLPPALSDPT